MSLDSKKIANSAIRRLLRTAASVSLWFVVTVVAFGLLLWLHYSGTGVRLFSRSIWLDGYAIGSNLLLALLSSFAFYFLVVYIPTSRRRSTLRRSQLRIYRSRKRNIIIDIIRASRLGGRTDLESDSDTIDMLMVPTGFRAAFEGGHEGNEGFYAFLNGIQSEDYLFKGIIYKFRSVGRQIDYLTHVIEIHDEERLTQLRRMEQLLFELETLDLEYDGVKQFGNIVFNIMADWSMIDGYRELDGQDLVERAIKAI